MFDEALVVANETRTQLGAGLVQFFCDVLPKGVTDVQRSHIVPESDVCLAAAAAADDMK